MSDKKSIAFVANTSWSIYKFRLNSIHALIEKGFTVYVLAPYDKYAELFKNIPGLTFIELKNFQRRHLSPAKDIRLYKEFLTHYRSLKPDLIFHFTIKANIFGTLAASRTKLIAVSVITGLGYTFLGNIFLRSAAKLLYRFALQKSAEVWFLNTDDQFTFTSNNILPKEKTFVLPGEGVDTDAFYPVPYEEKRVITFLMIARLIKHKGIYEYIQAAEILQQKGLNIQFQLLGFFEESSAITISRLEIADWEAKNIITYLGDTDNVVPFISQADCIVLPSYREGLPLSLLEGASMCKALVASNTAGCRDIVTDGVNGYLCREKDSLHLAEKMEAYYRLPAEAKTRMGLAGREKVVRLFKKEIITGIYLEKAREFLSRNNAGN